MDNCCCGRTGCVIPIVVGIITGILAFSFLTVTAVPVFLWIVFGLSLLALVILTAAALIDERGRENDIAECVCKNGACLLVGLFGALVTSVIGLITGTLGTVLLFLVTGFAGWTLAALFLLIRCIVYKRCE